MTPGTPGGLLVMLAEYGRLSLAQVLQPAIEMADGYPVEGQTVRYTSNRRRTRLRACTGARTWESVSSESPRPMPDPVAEPARQARRRSIARPARAALARRYTAFTRDLTASAGQGRPAVHIVDKDKPLHDSVK